VDRPAPADRYGSPVLPISSLLAVQPGQRNPGAACTYGGVVTLRGRACGLFVQGRGPGGGPRWKQTGGRCLSGDIVDVIGFPAVGRYVPGLQDGEFRRIGKGPLPKARGYRGDISTGDHDAQL